MSRTPARVADIPGTAIVLVHRRHILLLKRAGGDEFFPGYWDLPGGMVETDETNLQGAQRESREETGITTSHMEELFQVDLPADPSKGSEPVEPSSRVRRLKLTVFLSELDVRPTVAVNPKEHSEFTWMDASRLKDPNINVTPGARNVLRQVVRHSD